MIATVKVARVLLLVGLAVMALSFVTGVGTPRTGLTEKAVLLALIGGCVYLAALVTDLADRIVHRLGR